jgi:predicted DCC family thiol-disulfide oxidoreductase YuxK
MGSTRGEEPPRRLVLFDGVCVFCDGAVRKLIAADPDASLRFAPLQGETAKALRARHPEIPLDLDTIVFVEAAGAEERIHLRTDAVIRIAALVPGPWRRRTSATGCSRACAIGSSAGSTRVRCPIAKFARASCPEEPEARTQNETKANDLGKRKPAEAGCGAIERI